MGNACIITISDWTNIVSVIVNIISVIVNTFIAVWVVRILQNKLTNNRTLKDHFINEVKEIRSEYRTFLNNLYSNSTNPKQLLAWFKLMNIKVGDLISTMSPRYNIPKDFLYPYQNDLRELVTNSDDFERCFRDNILSLTEVTKIELTRFQQENQRLFNDLIIKINDSNN